MPTESAVTIIPLVSWQHHLIHPILSPCQQFKESFIAHMKTFCSGLRDGTMVGVWEDHRWSDVTHDRPFAISSAGAPSRMAGWRLDLNSFSISSELLRTRIIPAQQMLSFFQVHHFCFTSQSQPLKTRWPATPLPPLLLPFPTSVSSTAEWADYETQQLSDYLLMVLAASRN